MEEIKNREVKKLLSSDDLDLYPAKTLRARDVNMDAGKVFFLDVGVNPITYKYDTAVDRDQDQELLELYLD